MERVVNRIGQLLGRQKPAAMLVCFAVVGEEDERLDDYRRRLATVLY